jgi:hypothetical protein
MKGFKKTNGKSLDVMELYLLSKNLSLEFLLEDFLHSRGVYYSSLSENYIKSKGRLKRKVIITKLFYAVIFGILPIIPLFVYFDYIEFISSGLFDIEVVIFYIGIIYSIFFLLQFFNFLLMTIIETMGVMSSESIEWFKTLPLSKLKLKRIIYVTIFRNFDIPIIVILLAFPITIFIGTANFFLFIVSLGISFINTFLGLNFIIIISERLNRVLKIHSVSSKKTFFIRLINVFSYVFLILGSIYIIQWASTLITEFVELFMDLDEPEWINLILSIIPYPFSQSYMIALIISTPLNTFPLWLSTFVGIGLLIVIFYFTHQSALKSIKKVLYSETLLQQKQIYIEELKKTIKLKPKSAFKACLRKDLISISRDLKMFLSIVLPIVLSFIFVVYLNIPNFNPNELLGFQIFRIWMGFLLVSPMLSGMLVLNLLSLEESGQTILESLPLIPRDQARAKIMIMFVVLTSAILLPCLLFINSSQFLIVFYGMIYCLPFAWLFLFLSFELRILFFGKRNKSYVVGDVLIGSKEFKWITIFVIPLSISVWIISIITLLYSFANPFDSYFAGFISIVLITGFIFIMRLFKKLFPKIRLYEKEKISKMEKCQNYFTRHVWISLSLILFINFVFSFISSILSSLIRSFIPAPILWFLPYGVNFIDYIHYALFQLTPLFSFTLSFGFLYLYLIPKVFGIHPNRRKRVYSVSDDLGNNWMKYFRIIIYGVLITLFIDIVFIDFLDGSLRDFLSYNLFFLIYSLNTGFWLEIIYRGVILNLLTIKYEKKRAFKIHLYIVYRYSFLMYLYSTIFSFFLWSFLFPESFLPPIAFFFPRNFFSLIFSSGLYLVYSFFMSYVFVKSKNLLPNLFISLLFSLLYVTFMIGPIFPIPYFYMYPFYILPG